MKSKISQRAKNIIDRDLNNYLQRERQKYPFPQNYVPVAVEIRIDNARVPIEELSNYQKPTTIDIRFDGECAYFAIEGLVAIDRRPPTFK